jgi:hypothetical protein
MRKRRQIQNLTCSPLSKLAAQHGRPVNYFAVGRSRPLLKLPGGGCRATSICALRMAGSALARVSTFSAGSPRRDRVSSLTILLFSTQGIKRSDREQDRTSPPSSGHKRRRIERTLASILDDTSARGGRVGDPCACCRHISVEGGRSVQCGRIHFATESSFGGARKTDPGGARRSC